MTRKQFVEEELSRILRIAKPHLVRCEYVVEEVNGEMVYVHCENGYKYEICIEANSLAAIVEAVFNKMVCK